MYTKITSVAVLATAAQLAAAQIGGGLSSGCQASALSLVTGDFGSCADILGLTSVIATSGSIISPLSSWVNDVCGQAPCSNSTVSSASSTIQSGCSSDISDGNPTAVALNTIISNYPQVRNLVCLEYTGNSTNCIISTLTNIQTANNTQLTVSTVESLFSNLNTLVSSLNAVPSGAYCTDCGHAIFTEAAKIAANASSEVSSAKSALSSKCGSSFVNGQIPSDVSIEGASTSASSSSAPSGSASNNAGAALLPPSLANGPAGLLAGGAMLASIVAGAMTVLA